MSEIDSMRPWTSPTRSVLVWLAAAACGCLGSCMTMDTTSVEDHIQAVDSGAWQRRVATQRAALAATTQPVSTQPATATATAPAVEPAPTLVVSVEDAIFLSLENNRSLAVERLNPQVARTSEQQALAIFDPVLTARANYSRERLTLPPTTQVTEGAGAGIGVQEYLPTGTTLQLNGNTNVEQGDIGQDDAWTSRAQLTATQALLRGAGLRVNLVNVRQTRIDTRISQYELRGFTQDLVAQVEQTYWDCVLAQRQIEIVESSLAVARQQYEETRERIRIGKLAEVELAASEAEVALRREDLINANSALETTRLKLWRLVNPRNAMPADTRITLATLPTIPPSRLDEVGLHVELAMRMRPDLNQARLLVERNELELVRTRNGLLPKLDLFMTLGGTGYANSFGGSVRHVGDRNYDVLVGVTGEFPPLNRAARAQNQRATLDRNQALLALDNLAQLAEVDVRSAYVELKRAQEQVRATAVTRRLQEETLRAETEKFRVGKSTSLLVAAAQRDLLSGQLSEVQAVVTHLKAIVELYRLEGSLLDYRGVACPGSRPVISDAFPVEKGP
jgi:outer membrane protein